MNLCNDCMAKSEEVADELRKIVHCAHVTRTQFVAVEALGLSYFFNVILSFCSARNPPFACRTAKFHSVEMIFRS